MKSTARRSPVTNPAAVMQIIQSAKVGNGLASLVIGPTRPLNVEKAVEPSSIRRQEPVAQTLTESSTETAPSSLLKIHVTPEQVANENVYCNAEPQARQVDQLIDHLRAQQKDLAQREANLQKQIHDWEKKILSSESSLRKRNSELDQNLSQVKCQQTQLIELQDKLIKHQEAVGRIVEQLVEESDPSGLESNLWQLSQQLGSQLDSILGRWERLVNAMNIA